MTHTKKDNTKKGDDVPSVFQPSSAPPPLSGRGRCCGQGHLEDGVLSVHGAHEVEVGAQHDKDGEEGEAEAEATDTAAQREAQPIDEPAEDEDDGEQRHQLEEVLGDVGRHDSQLQEVEEEESQRVVDEVPVDRHLGVHRAVVIERRQDAVAQPGQSLHHHTKQDGDGGEERAAQRVQHPYGGAVQLR